jgi:hypothetical protein
MRPRSWLLLNVDFNPKRALQAKALESRHVMAKKLHDWIENDVRPFQGKSCAWLSPYHFFRDPIRPTYSELSCFLAPADAIIPYQWEVRPNVSYRFNSKQKGGETR